MKPGDLVKKKIKVKNKLLRESTVPRKARKSDKEKNEKPVTLNMNLTSNIYGVTP